MQRYRKPLLAYCGRLLPASRAEDAVQQTFLKAYQAMLSGDADLNLRPWLYRIAHNSSLNLLRQNGWSHEQLDENMDGVQRPDQALELRERLRATVAAVNSLPERQRNAVLLREVDGLTYEEIALALGVGDGAVRQLLHRARATLRAGASAVTPVGLLERIAAAMASGGDPSARVAEVAAGIGAGTGAVKLGAAMLATGVLATGAITVPLAHHTRHLHPKTEAALAAPAASASHATASGSTQVEDRSGSALGRSRRDSHRGSNRRHHDSLQRSASGRRLAETHGGGSGEHSGGDRNSGSGTRDGSGDGGGDHHGSSGSGDTSGTSGSHDGGGSTDGSSTTSGGDGGGTTTTDGGGGSNDGQTLLAPTGTTGSSGSTSGQDGGGDSSSGTSSTGSGD